MKAIGMQIFRAIRFIVLFTCICGILYTLLITAVGRGFFPSKANGSLIKSNGAVVGSALISQPFTEEKYLWGRIETKADVFPGFYYATSSNKAVESTSYKKTLKERAKKLGLSVSEVPIDLVTGSGSGFDPDISLYSALIQAGRISNVRNIPKTEVIKIMNENSGGLPGDRYVNVLKTNLALDALTKK